MHILKLVLTLMFQYMYTIFRDNTVPVLKNQMIVQGCYL